MTTKNHSTWDIGRFWQTLTYFDVLPFISNIQRLFSGDNQSAKINLAKPTNMNTILVIGANGELEKTIIEHFIAQNYRVRVVANNLNGEQKARSSVVADAGCKADHFGSADKVELWEDDISPELMTGVKAVIYCGDIGNNSNSETTSSTRLLELISNYNRTNTVFDFTSPNTELKNAWGAVDDVVMGGVSQSDIRLRNNNAVFSGIVSTDNNGGFASVRTRNFDPPLDLSAYEGIQLKVQGDGKRYKFITRCEGKWDGVGYCYSFDTIYNYPITVSIPFKDLIPVFRAKTVTEAGSFDASKVYSMQLMLSKFEYDGALNPKFEPGFFSLEVEYINAYSSNLKPKLVLISSSDLGQLRETEIKAKGIDYKIISLENEINLDADCLQEVRRRLADILAIA
jgi:hypothetical protein